MIWLFGHHFQTMRKHDDVTQSGVSVPGYSGWVEDRRVLWWRGPCVCMCGWRKDGSCLMCMTHDRTTNEKLNLGEQWRELIKLHLSTYNVLVCESFVTTIQFTITRIWAPGVTNTTTKHHLLVSSNCMVCYTTSLHSKNKWRHRYEP